VSAAKGGIKIGVLWVFISKRGVPVSPEAGEKLGRFGDHGGASAELAAKGPEFMGSMVRACVSAY